MGVTVPANATTVDRIRQIHGSAVASEIIEFKASSNRWGFKAAGWISNANYSVKKTVLVLFINHRSVESQSIKKAIEQTYATFLPKGGHPFVYLSLDIEPHRLDVNVHPTKREVHFLHEDEIIEEICNEARVALGNVDTSRTFMTQTLLPSARIILSNNAGRSAITPATPARFIPVNSITPGSNDGVRNTNFSTAKKTPRPYDNDLVRTDSRERKITSMLPTSDLSAKYSPAMTRNLPRRESTAPVNEEMNYEIVEKESTLCRLRSVKELRTEVREMMHNELTDTFASHTFVGIVDPRRRIAAVQSGVKLFLVDYGMVANEYFYQLGLTDFGNFGSIKFDPPLDLTELLRTGAQYERDMADSSDAENVDWDDIVEKVRQRLIDRRAMLAECFSLSISEDGALESIPLLMKGYIPPMSKLPDFLIRLGPFVNWNEEKPCFHTLLRELANFYAPESVPIAPSPKTVATDGDITMQNADDSDDVTEDLEIAKRRAHLYRALENVMFPAFKARLVATKGLLKGVIEIANLKGLYRVFERC
jgi:DNA mismatch repair protein MLH1